MNYKIYLSRPFGFTKNFGHDIYKISLEYGILKIGLLFFDMKDEINLNKSIKTISFDEFKNIFFKYSQSTLNSEFEINVNFTDSKIDIEEIPVSVNLENYIYFFILF
jgi:hypothetical protein